jgi:Raf kinase inhibitor-like YbhB/YbcL family protein
VLPDEYTGNGRDISPELIWENPPAGVQSFALICEDPDAPGRTFVHWVIYDIPADRQRLARAIPRQPEFDGMRQGRNDFGSVGYRGPMPPPGRAHRYSFRLFALNQQTGLEPGAGADELRQAMAGHLLAEAGLMCTYRR